MKTMKRKMSYLKVPISNKLILGAVIGGLAFGTVLGVVVGVAAALVLELHSKKKDSNEKKGRK